MKTTVDIIGDENYSFRMIDVRKTAAFTDWFSALRDVRAKARIDMRIARLALGNFGDARGVGGPVSELRVNYGPGYRVYFTRRGEQVVILLCGGDKSSQAQDIERAKAMAKE